MNKVNLKNVTLVCIDSVDFVRAYKAMNRCMEHAEFYSSYLISCESNPIRDKETYSAFVLKELSAHIDSMYCLICQYDGFIVNPSAWTDEFLNYDYVGAPWWYEDQFNVGNGGFSLRSKRLLEATAKFDFKKTHPEDDVLCRTHRKDFEAMGLKFAPEELAARFSWEGNGKYRKYNGAFGFHGKSNLKMFV